MTKLDETIANIRLARSTDRLERVKRMTREWTDEYEVEYGVRAGLLSRHATAADIAERDLSTAADVQWLDRVYRSVGSMKNPSTRGRLRGAYDRRLAELERGDGAAQSSQSTTPNGVSPFGTAATPEPAAVPDLGDLIANAATVEALYALHAEHQARWTDAHTRLAGERKEALQRPEVEPEPPTVEPSAPASRGPVQPSDIDIAAQMERDRESFGSVQPGTVEMIRERARQQLERHGRVQLHTRKLADDAGVDIAKAAMA